MQLHVSDNLLSSQEMKSKKGYWQDVKPTGETNSTTGRMVYSGAAKWPEDGQFHTLTIQRADSGKGGKGFDLLFDDKVVAHNVQVGFLRKSRAKRLIVGVSGQGRRLGGNYRFEADEFRIYRLKHHQKGRSRR